MLIIEHNGDVIKMMDYLIDIDAEGGKGGSQVVTMGTPEQVSKSKKSYTAKFLKEVLKTEK